MRANSLPSDLDTAEARAELRFMSVKQVADYLQVNEKKVYALATSGRIPGTKVTGKWLFPRDLVDQWLWENSHGGVLTDRMVVAGSDDPLLHRVVARLAEDVQAKALVGYTATGTRLGLGLLAAGRAEVCGLHWGPVAESHIRHPALISGFSGHHQWVLVRAFRREQGLIIGAHVKKKECNFDALRAPRFRWAFRQDGAGTQRFFQELLANHKVAASKLNCTCLARSEREAGALVAMDEADVAPGTRGAAGEAGLRFVPIGWEAFDFALDRGIYFRTLFQRLLDELKSSETRALADRLGGYALDETGKLVWAARD